MLLALYNINRCEANLHQKKHLSFAGLRSIISQRLNQIEDNRRQKSIDYAMHDCFMAGFAMMFFQDPALVEFQQRMQDKINFNNLKSIFQIANIPKETQMRDIIDQAPYLEVEGIFVDFFTAIQRGKQLEQFKFMDDYHLIPIDGTSYFSSDKIHCPGCLTKTKKSKIRYEHQILQAAVVCPGIRQVIPLTPEPIRNTDGKEKQDCEINAGKRILGKIRQAHPKLKIIITGDDLYSKQPFVDELKKNRMSYILVAKPSDHKILYEWVDDMKKLGESKCIEFKDQKKRLHRYEWVNQVPLNGTVNADLVNFFEYNLIVDNKVTFRGSWVTDIDITANNIIQLVKGGRARWKIENETFNTLKNQGYHLEHNFGHGKKNLSHAFFLLNLLAFSVHQILELCDPLYQTCRKKFSARKEYWNQLRCTFRILLFGSWVEMIDFIIDPEKNQRAP